MTNRGILALAGISLALSIPRPLWAQGVERGTSKVEVERSKSDSRVVDVYTKEKASRNETAGKFVITFADGVSRVVDGDLGEVEWKRDGKLVTGRIVASAGNEIAKIQGRVSASGMSGEFTDSAGRAGTWEWVGDIP